MFSSLLISNALAGFGGADLAIVGEYDSAGAELLLSAGVTPWSTERDRLELDWASVEVDFGAIQRVDRFDGLRGELIAGEIAFGSGTTGAQFTVGDFRWNPELAYIEVGVVQGGMGGTLMQERLRWGIGGDVHGRVKTDTALYLGLPLHVGFHQPLRQRPFVDAQLSARPSFGLVGNELGAFDTQLALAAGVHAIDEEEAQLDIVLGYVGELDTATDTGTEVVHRLGIGARARF